MIQVTVPLETDSQGTLRVSGTRIPFDNIVHGFLTGETPEEIAGSYPSVPLATVYSLIGHFLNHREELEAYLEKNREATNAAIDEGRRRQAGLRERLLAKRNTRR